MVIFYRIVDVAALNAFILSNYKPDDRISFMKKAAKSLVRQHTEKRLHPPQLSHELKGLISRVLGIDAFHQEETIPENSRLNVRENCYLCY